MKFTIFFFSLVFTFSLFAANKAKTVSLNISGMTCQSCANTVEKALKSVDGVKEAKVDLKNNKATVTLTNGKTTSSLLIKAVSDAGFNANDCAATQKIEMKKHSKSGKEDCDDGCCGDESTTQTKHSKTKKAEIKKS